MPGGDGFLVELTEVGLVFAVADVPGSVGGSARSSAVPSVRFSDAQGQQLGTVYHWEGDRFINLTRKDLSDGAHHQATGERWRSPLRVTASDSPGLGMKCSNAGITNSPSGLSTAATVVWTRIKVGSGCRRSHPSSTGEPTDRRPVCTSGDSSFTSQQASRFSQAGLPLPARRRRTL